MRYTLSLALVAMAGTALAQPNDQPPVTKKSDDRKITVMWAPIRAVIGLAEFTGEYRIADKLGVSVELGAGRRTLTFDMTDLKSTELEAGAQLRYYLIGSYTHGMEIGVEALEEHVTFDTPFPGTIVAAAAGGFTTGAFAGYKVATNLGFTFEGQLGARYLLVDPPVQGMAMATPINDQARWAPMAHINVGWTF